MFYNISVKEALNLSLQSKAVLLDLRTEEEYRKGHLPTAILVPENQMEVYLKKYEKVKKILYCNYGNNSLKKARELSMKGYDVYSIVGGYHAYEGYIELEKNKLWTMEWKSAYY